MDENLAPILSVLRTTAERWIQLAEIIPDHLMRRQPSPGEWSAIECLQHLLNTERNVFPVRTRYFLEGKDLANYNPDEQETPPGEEITPAELAAEFRQRREVSLTLLSGLHPEDLGRRANHEELGSVSLGEMLHEWAAHDLMHTVQAERAMMQPFIAASGPWKPFFQDHAAV